MGIVEYPFIAITPRSTRMVLPVRVQSVGQIEQFHYLLKVIFISYLKPYSCAQIIYIT